MERKMIQWILEFIQQCQKKIPSPVQQWGVTVKKWVLVYFLYCTNVLAVEVNVMHCESMCSFD